MLEAEALVISYGPHSVALARELASDPRAPGGRRAHYGRVARIARRRHEFLTSLDTGTKYDVVNQWRSRRGAMNL
ncbi:hypothetical protein [uncultured Paracoccus sp.]|uniref:hypothetical protein n=1 Tax=uncultured Paracoccus sp. TaxID=189685 RepID=UPI002637C76C|nr:hypothetical protein [uncultured Paracoccus sp.]